VEAGSIGVRLEDCTEKQLSSTIADSRKIYAMTLLPVAADAPTSLAAVGSLRIEPRCRVCRNDDVRRKVNGLLAVGTTYSLIVRHVEDPDADPRDRVTLDSVRNHTARHFPVQNAARATYRQILEQRAQENGVDFINAVATALTPMAFFETVMVRSYEALVDPHTKVDVRTGMVAAGRLQALVDSRAGQPDLLDMKLQLNQIIDAVKSSVPQEMWGEIVEKLNEATSLGHAADTSEDASDDDDLLFDPDDPGDVENDARSA